VIFEIKTEALDHLKQCDETMRLIIEQTPVPKRKIFKDYHEAVIDAVISQQIASNVYQLLSERFFKRFTTDLNQLKSYSVEDFASIGLSQNKAIAIHSFLKGDYPNPDDLLRIKGIGPWTVAMVKIFYSQDPDIFAASDGGIKKALENHYQCVDQMCVEKLKNSFSPYGTTATLYLWESLV